MERSAPVGFASIRLLFDLDSSAAMTSLMRSSSPPPELLRRVPDPCFVAPPGDGGGGLVGASRLMTAGTLRYDGRSHPNTQKSRFQPSSVSAVPE